jgi:hypothetical protein
MLKSAELWLPALLRRKIPPCETGKPQVILAVCDHYEPFHQSGGSKEVALDRMARWIDRFPAVREAGFGADGRHPVHTFFYPCEQYNPDVMEMLGQLCRNGAGEAEVHLHHKDDNYQSFVDKIEAGKTQFASHGLLSKDPQGKTSYGFVHGNWAITNSHPDGNHCGVTNEIKALIDSGCYADFTMPCAPDPCQSRIVNSIYFARDVAQTRSHDFGIPAEVGMDLPQEHLLFVQGPLTLNWQSRKLGILPRLENADLTLANPPSRQRFMLWVETAVHLHGRREWVFVKLHTHGCNPKNIEMHLGSELRAFYSDISAFCSKSGEIDLYFVTAREMVNIALAALAGKSGSPSEYRDYKYRLP